MRQRNDTGQAWHFAAAPATDSKPEQPPYSVEPGDTVDYPQLLDGWTAAPETPAPAKTRGKKTAEDEGGEPS
ncbi:hypothetical protein AB0M92_19160 [Streptomyces sp. NPDC051582]|uniref:hypothetical protein n=1 Tax=Streptomyces sp. NPDC051582 TaxID=3155167 RepID=UPI003435A0BD